MKEHEQDLAVALTAAELAGQFIRQEYESFTPMADAPVTISTHVDKGSQEIILQHLRAAFPDDGLCAEEDTPTPQVAAGHLSAAGAPRRVWVVDPIDGTRGFVMKNGEFSVMIGLLVAGVPTVGVVLEPVTMRWTYATLGGGCWTRLAEGNSIRCTVHRMADPEACVLVQSHAKNGPSPMEQALTPAKTLSMYSAGVKLAVVARGEGDVYVNNYANFKDWDICAGHILVTEAGGTVCGTRGEAITYGNPGFEQRAGLVAGPKPLVETILPKLANLL